MLLLPTTSKLLVGDYQVGNANLAGASPDASIARGLLVLLEEALTFVWKEM